MQTRLTYETNLKVTVNDILNNKFRGALEALRYIIKRDGLMSIASATVHALMRSEKSKIYPDLKVQIMLISGNNRYSRNKNHGMDPFQDLVWGFSHYIQPQGEQLTSEVIILGITPLLKRIIYLRKMIEI